MTFLKRYSWWIFFLSGACLFALTGKRLVDGTGNQAHLWAFIALGGALGLGGALLLLHSKWAKLSSMAAGILLLAVAAQLTHYRNHQVELYNEAMQAYASRDAVKAIKALDASLSAYKQDTQRGPLKRLIYGEPRRDLAALALFHKANILIQVQKADLAVEAFKESLRINPGDEYHGLSPSAAESLNKIALDTKYNLEMLFKSGQASGQGKGKGKGEGKGKPSNQREPGDDPGTQRGHGNRDDI